MYLDFSLKNHTAKTNKRRWRAANKNFSCSGARDQELTNHSAHCVE